jgi:lysophospholipase L1-like esterase
LSRTRFLAFGDSTTAGEVPVATTTAFDEEGPNYKLIIIPAAAYPSQLLSLLRGRYTGQTAVLEVINSGSPTEWAEDGALRFPGVMSNTRPQAVLLLEGVNDLAALGTRGVQSAWRAVDTMAKEARNRGARVFIATLPPPRPSGTKAVPVTLIQSLNSNIRDTVRGEGAVLVDLFTALSTDVNRYISLDGLHPTEAGYQKIAETFFEAIRQDLEIR